MRSSSLSLTAAACLAGVSACSDSPTQLEPESTGAPASVPSARAGVIPGRFIITLRDGESPAAVAAAHGIRPEFVYTHALTGFAGGMGDAARAGLLRDRRVIRIEPDGIATIVATTEGNATWGLDRLDQRSLPLSTTFTYTSTGVGVTAYIIDTGIRFSHNDFGGRATSGYDAVDGGTAVDCNGHGTHVAGTVGGSRYGVAKRVHLVAVRVLDCGGSGTWSGVIAGIDWVTRRHASSAVANLSLGGGANASVDDAVRRMISAGVSTAIAAGNGNSAGIAQNACNFSPARVSTAMTVGATDRSDRKATWSNYGSCVDWFAPGVGITSTWFTSNSATNTISGTSMAAPHTAGVAALYLQLHPGRTPQQVRDALFAATTKDIVRSSSTANNDLLFTRY
jgi:subtilisin family serine protease